MQSTRLTVCDTPVFIKEEDLHGLSISNHDIYQGVSNIIGKPNVVCVQKMKKIWKVYTKDDGSRITLLARRFALQGKTIAVYDSNPLLSQTMGVDEQTEKITLKDLPLSLSNTAIQDFLAMFHPHVKVTSEVRYGKAWDQDKRPTDCLNGDRYVYAQYPILPIIPRNEKIDDHDVRIFHSTQFEVCRLCKKKGHKFGPECNLYDSNANIIPFRFKSAQSELSNFSPVEIEWKGKQFHCVEQAFQWEKATSLKRNSTASKILKSKDGAAAQKIARRELPPQESKTYDVTTGQEVMAELLEIKLNSCPDFRYSILHSGDVLFAEATFDPIWGCCLNISDAACTKPCAWQGDNRLGFLLNALKSQHSVPSYNDSYSEEYDLEDEPTWPPTTSEPPPSAPEPPKSHEYKTADTKSTEIEQHEQGWLDVHNDSQMAEDDHFDDAFDHTQDLGDSFSCISDTSVCSSPESKVDDVLNDSDVLNTSKSSVASKPEDQVPKEKNTNTSKPKSARPIRKASTNKGPMSLKTFAKGTLEAFGIVSKKRAASTSPAESSDKKRSVFKPP